MTLQKKRLRRAIHTQETGMLFSRSWRVGIQILPLTTARVKRLVFSERDKNKTLHAIAGEGVL